MVSAALSIGTGVRSGMAFALGASVDEGAELHAGDPDAGRSHERVDAPAELADSSDSPPPHAASHNVRAMNHTARNSGRVAERPHPVATKRPHRSPNRWTEALIRT